MKATETLSLVAQLTALLVWFVILTIYLCLRQKTIHRAKRQRIRMAEIIQKHPDRVQLYALMERVPFESHCDALSVGMDIGLIYHVDVVEACAPVFDPQRLPDMGGGA